MSVALPEWACPIEVLHRRDSRHFQHSVQGAGRGRGHSAHVEVEVEVRGVLPSRRRGRRRRDDSLAQHRHLARNEVEAAPNLVPIRRSVEHDHRHDRGTQSRIAFHRPGERVAIAHELGHLWSTYDSADPRSPPLVILVTLVPPRRGLRRTRRRSLVLQLAPMSWPGAPRATVACLARSFATSPISRRGVPEGRQLWDFRPFRRRRSERTVLAWRVCRC